MASSRTASGSSVLDKLKEHPVLAGLGVAVVSVSVYAVIRRLTSPHRGSDAAATEDQSAAAAAPGVDVLARGASTQAAAETLARAHASSSVVLACAAEGADADTVQRKLASVFKAVLSAAAPRSFGTVVLQTPTSVAVWVPPGATLSPATLDFHGMGCAVKALAGSARARRFPALLSTVAARAQRLAADQPLYHLAFVGGADTAAVITPLVQRADATSGVCVHAALSSANDAALAAASFTVEETFDYFGAPVRVFVRSPRS